VVWLLILAKLETHLSNNLQWDKNSYFQTKLQVKQRTMKGLKIFELIIYLKKNNIKQENIIQK
jgi:hypothetical protein